MKFYFVEEYEVCYHYGYCLLMDYPLLVLSK